MIPASSNAFLALPPLDYRVWTDWHNDCTSTPPNLSTATDSDQVSDIIALAIDNSGASHFYVVNLKRNVNAGIVSLLTHWIEEYGDDEDPDLDLQLAELRSSRLAFRERC